jgi:uracil-DNA glycosylase
MAPELVCPPSTGPDRNGRDGGRSDSCIGQFGVRAEVKRSLTVILEDARACAICAGSLPHAPRPLLQAASAARLLIIGQAPGVRAHESGTPWDDRSGDRLRDWLGLTHTEFYDDSLVALLPMGFCYPGRSGRGDLPPRPECAPEWHDAIRSRLTKVELTVLVGKYAVDAYLGGTYAALTQAVRDAESLLPEQVALPHPSPRNNIWLAKHRWFEDDVLPLLRTRVSTLLKRSRS